MKKTPLSKAMKLIAFFGIPVFSISCLLNSNTKVFNESPRMLNKGSESTHVETINDFNEYTPWEHGDYLPTEQGDYILSVDVTLSSVWTVPTGEVNLNLSGHVIRQTATGNDASVIKVATGSTLGIYDDEETPHYFTYSSTGPWTYIENPSEQQKLDAVTLVQLDGMETIPSGTIVNVSGGVITGGQGTYYNDSQKRTASHQQLRVGGGVVVDGGGFTLNDGTIVGNTGTKSQATDEDGGGVTIFPNSTFTMKGNSAVIGNYADTHGGGVCTIGGTLNLNGGRISYNNGPTAGGGLNVGAECHDETYTKAIFNMSNGEISHNISDTGGGLQLCEYSEFTMTGGKITNNTDSNFGGGGIRVTSWSKFDFSGGEISDNKSMFRTSEDKRCWGGGIRVDDGTFTMTGGKISGNYSDKCGGGVSVYGGTAVAIITGGEISGNTAKVNGSGVHLRSGSLTLGGTIKIIDNTKTVENSEVANNLYLMPGKTFAISEDAVPTEGMSVGISTETAPTGSANVILTSNGGEEDKAWFTSDNINYHLEFNTDHLELAVHKHDDHVFETNWTSSTSLPTTAGSYFLSTDVTLSGTWTVPNGVVDLCLCGHVINQTSNAIVINVPTGGTLNLFNCEETPHYFTYYNNAKWVYIATPTQEQIDASITISELDAIESPEDGTIIEVTGGVITGGNSTTAQGGAISNNGVLTMNDCNVVGNKAQHAGAIGGFPQSTKTELNDCIVCGNQATGDCGGIYGRGTKELILNNCNISYNTSATWIGGVGVNSQGETYDSDFVGSVNNCLITHNKTTKSNDGAGAGIHINTAGTMTITDTTITNNSSGNIAGGADFYRGSAILKNTTITNNKSSNGNGGVYLRSEFTSLTLGGTTNITDNENGNLYIAQGKTITIGTDTYAPAEGMSVGISTEVKPVDGTPVRFTSNGSAEQLKYFSSDDSTYFVNFNDSTGDEHFELKVLAENAITNLKLEGWTYGDTPNTPTFDATHGKDTAIITYSTSEEGEYTPTVPTNAGTYWVKVEIPAGTDYKGASATTSFTISKQEKVIPTPTNLHFDKEKGIFVADPSDPYTITDKVTAKGNVNVHTVTASLKDKINFCWEDGTTDDLTFTIEVAADNCYLHWIVLGIFVVEIILFVVLYLLFKFKLPTIISLGAGTVGSIVFFIIGKCNLCYIFAAINMAICIAGLVYIFLKRNKDDEKEEPVKETATSAKLENKSTEKVDRKTNSKRNH